MSLCSSKLQIPLFTCLPSWGQWLALCPSFSYGSKKSWFFFSVCSAFHLLEWSGGFQASYMWNWKLKVPRQQNFFERIAKRSPSDRKKPGTLEMKEEQQNGRYLGKQNIFSPVEFFKIYLVSGSKIYHIFWCIFDEAFLIFLKKNEVFDICRYATKKASTI